MLVLKKMEKSNIYISNGQFKIHVHCRKGNIRKTSIVRLKEQQDEEASTSRLDLYGAKYSRVTILILKSIVCFIVKKPTKQRKVRNVKSIIKN